jgi:hypothetical protein
MHHVLMWLHHLLRNCWGKNTPEHAQKSKLKFGKNLRKHRKQHLEETVLRTASRLRQLPEQHPTDNCLRTLLNIPLILAISKNNSINI